jgi:secondary thiamine-phosphate synthase enzyme
MHLISVKTHNRCELLDLTAEIRQILTRQSLSDGLVVVYVPHTTAGVTINENADPDVCHDLLLTLERLIPPDSPLFRHSEGNSDAHAKASLIGSSVTLIVENSQLQLGTWQGIFFCEFDGPRSRQVMLKLIPTS